jgi:hypothetical protein
MIPQKQLLCTFSTNDKYLDVVKAIAGVYELIDKKIFLFVNEKNIREIYLTFNVVKNPDSKVKYPNTISVHRKKQTNTLYTLNAMNRLIEDENNGVFDKSYQLNWDLYKNSIILTSDPGVKIVSLRLFSILPV